ncbi:MAG TPA: sulfotransferase [Gaiellaceae bacterium]|nr:sulfotransferase [Gaiellaceae bacterium]
MLPNLLVIGAMKAGTTSLHRYLDLHPEIAMSPVKEPRFFSDDANWARGVEWYEEQFPDAAPVRGEATPDYTKAPEIDGVPERIHAVVPDAKLVYLVRDPIERIVSQYVDQYANADLDESLDAYLRSAPFERLHLVNVSRYMFQIDRYLPLFDGSRLLVVASEDLRDRRRETLATVYRFLGVDESFWDEDAARIHHPSGPKTRKRPLAYRLERAAGRLRATRVGRRVPARVVAAKRALSEAGAAPIARPRLDPGLRRELAAFLREDVERLRAFTGGAFAAWEL